MSNRSAIFCLQRKTKLFYNGEGFFYNGEGAHLYNFAWSVRQDESDINQIILTFLESSGIWNVPSIRLLVEQQRKANFEFERWLELKHPWNAAALLGGPDTALIAVFCAYFCPQYVLLADLSTKQIPMSFQHSSTQRQAALNLGRCQVQQHQNG